MGDYSDTTEAVVLFAATLGCVAVLNWLMIRRAVLREHIHPLPSRRNGPFSRPSGAGESGVFMASVPVGFLSALAAELALLALAWPMRVRRATAAQGTRGRDTSR